MTNWLTTLKGETQAKMLQRLRAESQSITGLAEYLGLTDNAVRTHVAVLEREGLIERAGVQRDTGGKPARLYRLSRKGEELFPKAYALVLGTLLDEVTRRDGQEAALELLGRVGQRLAPAGEATSPEERVRLAADTLRALGGQVLVEPQAEGWLLRGLGCPLASVTREFPDACALARALVEEITGMPVAECCERGDRPRCRFQIRMQKQRTTETAEVAGH